MTPREFLLEFLKFHYKQNPFRKQETNEKDIEDFIAELPADFEVKNILLNPVVSGRSELLFAFIAEVKKEFADQNWDYLNFIAERVLKANNSH